MENKKFKTVDIIEIPTNAEETLKLIASIVLWLGIIASFAFLCTIATNPMGLVVVFGSFFSSIISWAMLRVVANISLRLKAIQDSMPLKMVEDVQKGEVILNNENQSEEKADSNEKVIHTTNGDIEIGTEIIWLKNGKKYTVENIDKGKICFDRGFFTGYIWCSVDQIKKV